MTAHAETAHGTTKLYVSVWLWLVAMTLIEVFLAYEHVPLKLMLVLLLGLSFIKAALIVSYFMHLRWERMSLVLTLIPIAVVCLCLMMIFFPDSFRLYELGIR
jgi:cytochrome c oxidase subunit 4